MALRAIGIAAGVALGLASAGSAVRADDHPEAVDRSALRVCADPANLPFSND